MTLKSRLGPLTTVRVLEFCPTALLTLVLSYTLLGSAGSNNIMRLARDNEELDPEKYSPSETGEEVSRRLGWIDSNYGR